MELYKKYRPGSLKKIIGNEALKKSLAKFAKSKATYPHATLITGPSGCGKTTVGRIIAKRILNTSDNDLKEINCADFRGIDTARDIRSHMSLAPIGGESRTWLIDEAHQLTTQAQDSFLKLLEDPPNHAYFIICTTDPAKLITAFRNRCTELKVAKPKPDELMELLGSIMNAEGFDVAEDSLEQIIEASECSVRKALVILEQLVGVDEQEHSDIIQKAVADRTSIELCRALMNPKCTWPEVTSILKKIEDEPEKVRRCVLGYMANVMLSKSNKRAAAIIEAFRDNYFDSGKAGLVISCYEVVS